MSDLIDRQAAIDLICDYKCGIPRKDCPLTYEKDGCEVCNEVALLEVLPAAQPTLNGYNIRHLELIANILRKEDLPPERIAVALTDISRIVAIVEDEFEEALRKAVEQCPI